MKMIIHKYPQSTLLIEYKGKRILFDPGRYCKEDTDFGKVDILLITHKHSDHCGLDFIKKIQDGNSVITLSNKEIKDYLSENDLKCDLLKMGETKDIEGIKIKGIKQKHGDLPSGMPPPEVIGFLIDDKIYNPGDSVYMEEKPYADVVCVPICGTVVMSPADAAKFCKEINPKLSIPIHYDNPKYPVDPNDFVKEMDGFNVKVLANGESLEV